MPRQSGSEKPRPPLISGLPPQRRQELHDEIAELSVPSGPFYVMVVVSATIASYGLLTNSTAVVIGAMLVAPLMGPIFGISLGLIIGDRRLFARAFGAELLGVCAVIGLGLVIGLVPFRLDLGSEVLARTQPTLYDILIALAAGLAGAYTLAHERLSPSLPGVAIAVALVPPLATCGLCLSAADWDLALGAFLLFLANFLAIQVAAAAVFTALRMVEVGTADVVTVGDYLRRFSVSLLALAVVAVFMTHTLLKVVSDRRFRDTVETTLAQEVQSTTGAQLSDVRIGDSEGTTQVIAVVMTPVEFDPQQVTRVEQALRDRTTPDLELVIRSLLSKDCDARGPVYVSDEPQQEAAIPPEMEFLQRATDALVGSLHPVLGAQLAELKRDARPDLDVITAYVRTPIGIDPDQVAEAEKAIQDATGAPVHLIVRSIVTQDADAHRYLYEPSGEEPEPLTGEALRLQERLEEALGHQLAEHADGAVLTKFQSEEMGDRLRVLAVTQTPRVLAPEDVGEIEAKLRQYVDQRIDLVIRSAVGADATSDGYVTGGAPSQVSPPL